MNLFDPATPTGRLLREMWRDIQISSQENSVRAAKADPEKHKMSKLIADNKPANYSYFTEPGKAVRGRLRRRVSWCWSKNPNIAGYYLSWRQVETKRTIKRTQFKAHKHEYLGEKRCREKAHPKPPK
jgi:hypothetical protein